ncbi:SRPBCC family protein [Winogradskyella flava]|uniref:SRPBCC family protein n=1 Tax=Winogradskyella flava TaxID=1884876 RepID=UPI0024937FC3|nr:SRPBCC domain-containing protein [Winogradskyella flava]
MLDTNKNISDLDYRKQIKVASTAENVFKALTDHIHLWWSKTTDSFQKANGQFTITFDNGYWWTFKIIEFKPNSELVWKCIDGEPEFNKEWIGHVLHWLIIEDESETIINFHQAGLTPQLHCFEVCSSTWDMFITKKLKNYLERA